MAMWVPCDACGVDPAPATGKSPCAWGPGPAGSHTLNTHRCGQQHKLCSVAVRV